MTNSDPYVLSIETEPGKAKQYGFHLGTDLALAKKIAEEKFNSMKAISVALFRKGEKARYFDFRREWSA